MPGTTGGDVIKEFVVSIKYVVDDTALNQSQDNIQSGYQQLLNKTTASQKLIEGVLALGLSGFTAYATGVTGALGSIAVALEDTMKAYTNFYYTTQQLSPTFKTNPANLQQLNLLSSLVGQSPDELQNQALALAKAMRDNPKDVLLNQFTHGEKDPVKALLDVAKALTSASKNDQFAIRSILRNIGLDPEAMRQLGLNAKAAQPYLDENAQTQKNLGLENPKNMANAIAMQRQLDLLDMQMQEVMQAFTLKTFPDLIKMFTNFNEVITKHSSQINTITTELPTALDHFFNFLSTTIKTLNEVDSWLNWTAGITDKTGKKVDNSKKLQTDSWSASALKALGNTITDSYKSIISNYDDLINPADKAKSQAQAIADAKRNDAWVKSNIWDPFNKWLTGVTQSPNVEIAAADQLWPILTNWVRGISTYVPFVRMKSSDNTSQNALTDQIQDLAKTLQSQGITPPTGNLTSQQRAQFPANAGQPIESKQQQANLKQAYDFFVAKGLSRDQAVGVVARLDAESGMNPNAVNPTSGAYGVAQWLGSRKPEAEAAGGDLSKQLEYVWKELKSTEKGSLAQIKAAKTAPQAAVAMESYERAGNPAFTQHAAAMTSYISKQLASAFSDPNALVNKKVQKVELSDDASNKTRQQADHILTETKFPASVNKVAEHQGAPNLEALNNLGKTLVNGLAPLNGMGNTHYAFSPQTTIHVHGTDGPQIGSKVAKAVGRTHANLYRNFQSQLV